MSPAAHDQNRLLEYAYGELAPSEAKSFEAHLKSCADCARALEDIRSVRRTMGQLPTVPAPNTGLDSLLAYAQQAARRAQAGPDSRSSFWKWVLLPASGALALVLVIVVSQRAADVTIRARTTLQRSSEVTQFSKSAPAPSHVEVAEEKSERRDSVRSAAPPPATGGAQENAVARSYGQLQPRRESVNVAAPQPTTTPARKAAAPAPLAKVVAPKEQDKDRASATDEVVVTGSRIARGKSAGVSQPTESQAADTVVNHGAVAEGAVVAGVPRGQGASPALAARNGDYKKLQLAPNEEIARIRNALATENLKSTERGTLLSRLCELLYAAHRSVEAESTCDQVIRDFPDSPAESKARELKAKNAPPPGH